MELSPVAQPVVDSHYHGKKVVDFQLSTNVLALLTGSINLKSKITVLLFYLENNKVYYSGMRNNAVPEEFLLKTDKKIKSIAATYNSLAVLLGNYHFFIAELT